MKVTKAHGMTQETAIHKVDESINDLLQNLPGGAEVSNLKKEWKGNTLTFSFTVTVEADSENIKGTITVDATNVVVNVNLPFMIALMFEGGIKQAVQENLNITFPQS